MHQAGAKRKIPGLQLSQSCPKINHLLFADDSLFFTLANQKSAKAIQDVLSLYEQASGQAVNLRKSAITFGSMVKPHIKTQLRRILGIHNEGGGGKYLGIPEQFTNQKTEMFQYLVDKVKEKTQGWHKRFLSLGGKEVLLKSIATAMPVYSMNVFKLPKGICEDINAVLARFWWNSDNERNSMHWFAWNRLCLPKKEGGIGFRDIESFNLALLGKQAWRLLQKPDCLMARVMRGRYYPDGNILNATLKRKNSFAWRSILQGADLMKRGLRFVIGDGKSISAWTDPWLQTHPPRAPIPRNANFRHYLLRDWFNNTQSGWNEDLIRELVCDEDISMVLSTKLCFQPGNDMIGWHYNKDGIYSVKSAYWLAMHLPEHDDIQTPSANLEFNKIIWNQQTVPKIKHFLWKIASCSLPTGETLRKRHIIRTSLCLRCCQQEESANHIFFECPYAQQVWRASGIYNAAMFDSSQSLDSKLVTLLQLPSAATSTLNQALVVWILWRIWKSRNIMVFQRKSLHWKNVVKYATSDATDWLKSVESAQTTQQRCNVPVRSVRNASWKRPPQGWIKCNYDGSFTSQGQIAKAGWIIRDDKGTFVGSGHAAANKATCAIESEFQALIIAMQNCWSRGYRKVIFEGDCKSVVDLLNKLSLDFGLYNWSREVWGWKNRFEDAQFTWVAREENKVADALAKRQLSETSRFTFYDFPPNFLSDTLLCDYISSS